MAYIGMNQNSPYGQYVRANGPRGFDWRYAAPVAGIAALPAIGAAFAGGSGFASVPGAVGASSAPLGTGTVTGGSGMGFSLGKLLGSRGFDTVANGVTSLLGMRAQNNANRYATDANSALMARQIAMAEAQIKAEHDANEADRADATRRFDAEQAFKAKEFDASEEERAYNRKLLEDREARRAVFRPYSESALRSLGAILGLR